jgi:hypothetical protein
MGMAGACPLAKPWTAPLQYTAGNIHKQPKGEHSWKTQLLLYLIPAAGLESNKLANSVLNGYRQILLISLTSRYTNPSNGKASKGRIHGPTLCRPTKSYCTAAAAAAAAAAADDDGAAAAAAIQWSIHGTLFNPLLQCITGNSTCQSNQHQPLDRLQYNL